MFFYTIPYQDKFILYRPLLRLAFIGNQAMKQLCVRIGKDPSCSVKTNEQAAYNFLKKIGFLNKDIDFPEIAPENKIFQPTVAVLFLTNQCNLRCIYCYASAGDVRPETLPLEMAGAAIDRVCNNAMNQGLEHYSLSFHGGGEPTTAWQLLKDCISYARKTALPVVVNLTSNGVWTDSQRTWLLDNVDEFSLSFDGLPSVQNRQRPLRNRGESHAAVLKTIHALDRKKCLYGIRITVTDESIDQLPDIITYLCQNTMAGTLQVEPAFSHGRARNDNTALSKNNRFAGAFLKGYDIACHHDRHLYYSGARPWLLTNRFCEAFDKALIVGTDGFITSCYEIYSRDHELSRHFIFGNMDSQGKISLDQQIRQNYLEQIGERKQQCRTCFCYFHCAGDCPSKTFGKETEKQKHLFRGSRCDLNQTITRELLIRHLAEGEGIWNGVQEEERINREQELLNNRCLHQEQYA